MDSGELYAIIYTKSDLIQQQNIVDYYLLEAKIAYTRGLIKLLHFMLEKGIIKKFISGENAKLTYERILRKIFVFFVTYKFGCFLRKFGCFFFLYPPFSGIAPCVGTAGMVHDTYT